MRTYHDIQTMDQITREEYELCGADLLKEFDVTESKLGSGPYELWRAGAYNQTPIYVLWFDRDGRAGIIHGGDPVWTDADSVQDAIERYFGTMIMATRVDLVRELENLTDRTSLLDVLTALEMMCLERAWNFAAKAIERAAAKASDLGL